MLLVIALSVTPLLALATITAFRRPFTALAAYAVVVPFGSTLPLPGPPLLDNVSSLVGLVAIGAFAARLATSRRPALPVRTPTFLWFLLVGVAAATAIWSRDQVATLVGTAVLISLVLLYVLVAASRVTLRDVRTVEFGLVLGGAIVGTYAVYLAVTGVLAGAVDERFVARLGGSETDGVADPNITAAALLLPFLVAVSSVGRRGVLVLRAAALCAAAVMFIAVFLTGSRGGLLALLLGLVVLIGHSPQWKRSAIGLLVPILGVVVAVAVAPPSVTERLSSDSRSSGRSDIWRIAVLSCPQYCLQGSGWSTFPSVHEDRWLSDPSARGVQRRFEAHSIWLGTLVEGGIVALTIVLAALWTTGRELKQIPRRLRGPPLAALLALVVSNSFLATLSFKYFWLVLMYVVLVRNLAPLVEESVQPRRREAVLA